MNSDKFKSISTDLGLGAVIGFINGIFGSGGGMIAVPLLLNRGFNQKDAQRNSISVIFPLSVISAALYLFKGKIEIFNANSYIPGGIIGAVIGTIIITKISPKLLKGIFGGFMLYAGIRLLIQ